MDKKYTYNGKEYTREQLESKYGDRTDEAISELGFELVVTDEEYTYDGKDYSRSQLEEKYGDRTDEAISTLGFELKKKDVSESPSPSGASVSAVAEPDVEEVSSRTPEGDDFEKITSDIISKDEGEAVQKLREAYGDQFEFYEARAGKDAVRIVSRNNNEEKVFRLDSFTDAGDDESVEEIKKWMTSNSQKSTSVLKKEEIEQLSIGLAERNSSFEERNAALTEKIKAHNSIIDEINRMKEQGAPSDEINKLAASYNTELEVINNESKALVKEQEQMAADSEKVDKAHREGAKEKNTWIEDKMGKNMFTDFMGDMARAVSAGQEQGGQIPSSMNLFTKGKDATLEEAQEFIDAANRLASAGTSEEMQAFMKTYEEEGSGFWGWVKGAVENPSAIPQVFVSSMSAMVSEGAVKGGLAGGAAAAPVGFVGGAFAPVTVSAAAAMGFMGGMGATLETALTFAEMLQEVVVKKKKLPFTKENVLAVLNDEEAMKGIRWKAAGRGIAIGAIDALSGGLAGYTTKAVAKSTGRKLVAATAGGTIEAVGGSLGETAGMAVAGQHMDLSEIMFEGVAGTATAPVTVGYGLLKAPTYKLNGQVMSGPEMADFVKNSEAADIAGATIEIKNDDVLKEVAADRKREVRDDAIIRRDLKEAGVTDESKIERIIPLEKKRKKLEGNKTEAGKKRLAEIKENIENIQSEKTTEDGVQESSTERVDAQESPKDSKEVGERDVQQGSTTEQTGAKSESVQDTSKEEVHTVKEVAEKIVKDEELTESEQKIADDNADEIAAEMGAAEYAESLEETEPKTSEMSDDEILKDTGDVKEVVKKQITNAEKAIKKFLPNVKFAVHENNADFAKAVGEGADVVHTGMYVHSKKSGVIHINLEHANARTVAHEVFHAAVLKNFKTNAETTKLTEDMVRAVGRSGKVSAKRKAELNKFLANYNDPKYKAIMGEELLAELTGMLAEEYKTLDTNTKTTIKAWIDKVAKALGLDFEVLSQAASDKEVIDFLNTIASKTATGKEIATDINVEDVITPTKASTKAKEVLAKLPKPSVKKVVAKVTAAMPEVDMKPVREAARAAGVAVDEFVSSAMDKTSETYKNASAKAKEVIDKVRKLILDNIRNGIIILSIAADIAAVGVAVDVNTYTDLYAKHGFQEATQLMMMENDLWAGAIEAVYDSGVLKQVDKQNDSTLQGALERALFVAGRDKTETKAQKIEVKTQPKPNYAALEKARKDSVQAIKALRDYLEKYTFQDKLHSPDKRYESFRVQYSSDIGQEVILIPNRQTRIDNDITKIEGIDFVLQFLLDHDPTNSNHDKQNDRLFHPANIALDGFVPVLTKTEGDRGVLTYKRYSEIQEGDTRLAPLRQYNFADIDFDGAGAPMMKSARELLLKNGKKSPYRKKGDTYKGKPSPINGTSIVWTPRASGKDGYGRFEGGAVTFIFEDKAGNRFVRDYAGSINGMKAEGKQIARTFGIPESAITMGTHDVGNFSPRPKGKNGVLTHKEVSMTSSEGIVGGGLGIAVEEIGLTKRKQLTGSKVKATVTIQGRYGDYYKQTRVFNNKKHLDNYVGWLMKKGNKVIGVEEHGNDEIKRFQKTPDLSSKTAFREELLEGIRGGTPFAHMTAENPFNKEATPEFNRKANAKMKAKLEKMGYEPVEVDGMYDRPENSFFVKGMGVEESMKIGVEFGQESVSHSQGMLYATGEHAGMVEASKGGLEVDGGGKEVTNYFSEIDLGDGKFKYSVDYDWGNFTPIADIELNTLRKGIIEDTEAIIDAALDGRSTKKLIEQRAAKTEKIADYKYANSLPVVDKARETAVLETAKKNVEAFGGKWSQVKPALEQAIARAVEVQEARIEVLKKESGEAFNEFFTDVSAGKRGFSNVKYTPELELPQSMGPYLAAVNRHRGHFDDHIAKSIPQHKEMQVIKGKVLSDMLGPQQSVLDIGGSENSFGKTITEQSGAKSVTVDPNTQMKKHSDATPVANNTYVDMPFMSGWEGRPAWKPSEKFDVVHESMVFQFINNKRGKQIDYIAKNVLENDGLLILEEKVSPESKNDNQWKSNEEIKDSYKEQYFTPEELARKKKDILSGKGDEVEGMHSRMVTDSDLSGLLAAKFDHVGKYWESGNFKGYIATNDAAKYNEFMAGVEGLMPSGATGKVNTSAKPNGKPVDSKGITPRGQRLAPNGKQSNLNEEQYNLVRTPEFKKWFGDWENDLKNASKVVDENGEPLVVYHGTKEKINEFDPKKISWESRLTQQGVGFNFTNNKKEASSYGKPIEVFLSIKNPFLLKEYSKTLNEKQVFNILNKGDYKWFFTDGLPHQSRTKGENLSREEMIKIYSKQLVNNGDKEVLKNIKRAYTQENYATLLKNIEEVIKADGVLENVSKKTSVYVSFRPNQIKLADGSNTTFDGGEVSIRKQLTGLEVERPAGMEKNITTGVSLKSLGDIIAHLTWADRLATGVVNGRTYKGGILYAAMTNSFWAATEQSGVNTIINNTPKNKDGYRYMFVALMKSDAHMSNKNMSDTAIKTLDAKIANGDAGVAEVYRRIKRAFAARKGGIKADLKPDYDIFTREMKGKPRTAENIIEALDTTFIKESSSYERRKKFLASFLGGTDRSRMKGMPSYPEIARSLEEPLTTGHDRGEVFVVIRTKGDLVSHQPLTGDVDYHPSYPYSARSVDKNGNPAKVETLILDSSYDATDLFPSVRNGTKSLKGDIAKHGANGRNVYISTLGGGSAPSYVRERVTKASPLKSIEGEFTKRFRLGGTGFTIYDVINDARAKGYTDDSIALYLSRETDPTTGKKFTKTAVKEAMAIPIDADRTLPLAFGNVHGGMIAGQQMFKDVMKSLKASVARMRPKTSAKMRAKAHELLRNHPTFKGEYIDGNVTYKEQASHVQQELISAFDSILGTSANQQIQAEIRAIRLALKNRKIGKAQLKAAQTKLKAFMRKNLAKTAYKKSEVTALNKKVSEATETNIEALLEEVTDFVTTQNVGIVSRKIDSILKRKYSSTVSGRKKGAGVGIDYADLLAYMREKMAEVKALNVAEDESAIEAVIKDLSERRAEIVKKTVNLTEAELNEVAAIDIITSYASASMMDDVNVNKVLELTTVLNNLNDLVAEGRSAFKADLKAAHERYVKQAREMFTDMTNREITDENEVQIGVDMAAAADNSNAKVEAGSRIARVIHKTARLFGAFFDATNDLTGLMDILSKSTGEMFGGKTQELVTNKIDDSSYVYKEGRMEINKLIRGKMEEIFGKNWQNVTGVKNNKQVGTGIMYEYTHPLTGKVSQKERMMSQNQLYYWYNMAKDEANHPAFETMFGENWAEAVKKIEKSLDPKVKEFADWQVDVLYPELYNRYNDVYRKVYRTNLPWNKFYAGRIHREGSMGTDVLDAASEYQASVAGASTKQRKKNKKRIKVQNGNTVLLNYIDDMEFFRAYGENVRDIQKMMNNNLIKDTITAHHGKEFYGMVTNMLDKITRNGDKDRWNAGIIDWFTKGFIRAKIGLNPIVMVKQLGSIFTYGNDIGYDNWLRYAPKSPLEVKAIFEEIFAASPYLRDRYAGDITNHIEVFNAKGSELIEADSKAGKAIDFIIKMVMMPTKLGDAAAIMIGGTPNYLYYKSEYMKKNPTATEQQAIEYAVRLFQRDTKRTQQSSDLQDRDYFQSSHPIVKAFNVFLTTPRQYLRKSFMATRQLARKARTLDHKAGKGTVWQNLRTLMVYHAALPTLFTWMGMGMPSPLDLDDDEKKELGLAALFGNLNAFFVLGELVGMGKDLLNEKPWAGKSVKNIPFLMVGLAVAQNVAKGNAAKTEETRDKYYDKAKMEVLDAATPAKGSKKMWENLMMILEGDVDDWRRFMLGYNDFIIKKQVEKKKGKKKTPVL